MKPTLNSTLSSVNSHRRDRHIKFQEDGHKYTISTDPHSKYTSATTLIHTYFPKFNADEVITNMMKGKNWKEGHKYWGLSPEQIKAQWNANSESVSSSGTDMHYNIECFMNSIELPSHYTHQDLFNKYMANITADQLALLPIEWQYFIRFVKDTPHLKPYRTEWLIFNETLKIAGSIDMVYENPDHSLSIYDWKRSKMITRINPFNKFATNRCICHMPDANFWHYALQLNIYKYILENKYGKVVKDLVLVRLHPDAEEKTYELIPLPNLSNEINELFEERTKFIKENA